MAGESTKKALFTVVQLVRSRRRWMTIHQNSLFFLCRSDELIWLDKQYKHMSIVLASLLSICGCFGINRLIIFIVSRLLRTTERGDDR